MTQNIAEKLPDPARAWVRTVAPLAWSWVLVILGRHGVDLIGWIDRNVGVGMEVATGIGIVGVTAILDGAARRWPQLDKIVHLLPGPVAYLSSVEEGILGAYRAGDPVIANATLVPGENGVYAASSSDRSFQPMTGDEWAQVLRNMGGLN